MRRVCAYENCRAPFEAKRADARYCKAVCRALASKARRRKDAPASRTRSRRGPAAVGAPASGTVASAPSFDKAALRTLVRAEVDAALAGVRKRLAEVESDIRGKPTAEALRSRVERIERTVGSLAGSAPSGKQDPGLARKVTEIESALIELAERVNGLERGIEAFGETIKEAFKDV